MKIKPRINQLNKSLKPIPDIEAVSGHELHIWWNELYAVLLEDEEGFLYKFRYKHRCEVRRKYLRFDETYRTYGSNCKSAVGFIARELKSRRQELDQHQSGNVDPMMNATKKTSLGKFKWDSKYKMWIGNVKLWEQQFEVHLQAHRKADPSAMLEFEHLEKIAAFKGNFWKKMQGPIYKKYNDCYRGAGIYRDEEGNDISEKVTPKLKRQSDIWTLIKPPYFLYLTEATEDTIDFGISAECTWDEEHGLGVRIKDWKVVAVGETSDACW